MFVNIRGDTRIKKCVCVCVGGGGIHRKPMNIDLDGATVLTSVVQLSSFSTLSTATTVLEVL